LRRRRPGAVPRTGSPGPRGGRTGPRREGVGPWRSRVARGRRPGGRVDVRPGGRPRAGRGAVLGARPVARPRRLREPGERPPRVDAARRVRPAWGSPPGGRRRLTERPAPSYGRGSFVVSREATCACRTSV